MKQGSSYRGWPRFASGLGFDLGIVDLGIVDLGNLAISAGMTDATRSAER